MLSAALAGCGSTPASSANQSASAAPENNDKPADSAKNAAADSDAAQNDASDLSYIKDKGTLVVGITDFEPMDYKDESGTWIGFDADMAKAFAESLGVSAEFVEIEWDN
ncbi:MAG: transporter substrate-binding domain-containing protein, partial [Lachnospiraceae bacterium]|nr:transporter substrate-binding domain-containing protein [Lachnospiraceae bacterium]